MASKLCPDGAEATLFSIMMSLSNFGYDVGTVFGSILLSVFNVSQDDWSGFTYVLAIKSVLRLVPIFFIPFLVPRGSPDDAPETMLSGDGDASSASTTADGGGIYIPSGNEQSQRSQMNNSVDLDDNNNNGNRRKFSSSAGYTPLSTSDVAESSKI